MPVFFKDEQLWTGYRFWNGFDYFCWGHAEIEVSMLHAGGDIKEAISARAGIQDRRLELKQETSPNSGCC